jgi:phage antirepressor YoqD-like protein
MNAIINVNTQSMTSLEIAELVQSRHDKVKQSIERLAERGVITLPPMGEKATAGRPSTFYVFSGDQGKRDSIIVVAQLCPEFTARLVDRWQELEAQIAKPADPMQILSDPTLLRNALLTYSELVIDLEQKVEVMQPTVEAYDRIAKADGSLCLTDAAKALQIRPKDLIAKLSAEKWIYKRAGNSHWLGYQDKVQAGYLEHKVTEVTRGDGTTKITEQVRVTPKGLAKLAKDQGGAA